MNREEYIEGKQRIKSFSPVEALKALSADFFDEGACRRWILKTLHPDGAHCPGCGGEIKDETTLKNFWDMRRCQCRSCGKWFTATTGTILHSSQLGMRQVYALALFLNFKLSDVDIAGILRVSSASVRLWRIKFTLSEKGRLF